MTAPALCGWKSRRQIKALAGLKNLFSLLFHKDILSAKGKHVFSYIEKRAIMRLRLCCENKQDFVRRDFND